MQNASGQMPSPNTKGHVLFVSRQRIVGRTNGSSAYLLDLAAAVRHAGYTPHLVQPSPDLMGRWPIMRLRSEMDVFETHVIRGVSVIARWVVSHDLRVSLTAVRAVASRLGRKLGFEHRWLSDRPRPYAIGARWTPDDRKFVSRYGVRNADIVIADYAFQAEAIDLLPCRPSAIIMHDLFHNRHAPSGGQDSVSRLDRDTEIALLSKADAVVAIQSAEAHFLADHVPSVRPILAPIAAHPVDQAQPGNGKRLLFVGSNTAPNVIGLEWMLQEIWPLVRQSSPQHRLDVIGSVNAAFPQNGPSGVTFHGMIDDLTRFYAQAGVVISPLTFGSGLKIKLIDALSKGKAIVATSVTLQGVEHECAGSVLLADEPADFAHAILQMADDDRRAAFAEASLEVARKHFSPQRCHAQFIAWLDDNCPPTSNDLLRERTS